MSTTEDRRRSIAESTRRWRLKYPERYRASAAAYRRKHISRKVDFVDRWKLAAGCFDCGYNAHPQALDFDHLRDKQNSVSKITKDRAGLARLVDEMEKCVVRCANCHRVKTSAERPRSKWRG